MKDNEFNCVLLDSDVCDGADVDTAHVLDCSFMKVDLINRLTTIFYGKGKDVGGGGISLGLRVEIEKLNIVASSKKSC